MTPHPLRGAPELRTLLRLARPLATFLLPLVPLAQDGGDGLVSRLHEPAAEHLDQAELVNRVVAGLGEEAFELAFEHGDELFETSFNVLDGVGARVGDGQRFTRVPRADLDGRGEWANHVPARATGPNAESCTGCHRDPGDDGSGPIAANVHRDPLHRGTPRAFLQRNTPHLFAPGAVQRLAEEMTTRLQGLRAAALREARRTGREVRVPLVAKGVSFGVLVAGPDGRVSTHDVEGLEDDLVVRPFQWKGSVAFLRDFNRGAAHNEIGMQADELVGTGVDGDGDRTVDELGVGDMTALAVYLAAQPRPTSRLELDRLGLLDPPLAPEERDRIVAGFQVLRSTGCAKCHVPSLQLEDPRFQEPSATEPFRDARFPDGTDPLVRGVDPSAAVSFDLMRDQPDNRIPLPDGSVFLLGALAPHPRGGARVDLFGDLKRHDLGPRLAEGIDEVGSGRATFLTENLWGVGSTAPYLHDGRATTLTEAILAHGGEAAEARGAFELLPHDDQVALIAFLENLVLFKLPEE